MTTTHLSESELVDLAEDALDPGRAAHVETCADCRAQGTALRAMLRDTAAVAVPDPSPLFWDHLSARVRDSVAAERPLQSGWAWTGLRGLVPFAAAAAVIVAVLSGVLLLRAGRSGDGAVSIEGDRSGGAASSDARSQATPDADNAEVWAVLTTAASGVGFDEAHAAGMHVQPTAIDHAVLDLSPEELTELGRLLQTEMKRASKPGAEQEGL